MLGLGGREMFENSETLHTRMQSGAKRFLPLERRRQIARASYFLKDTTAFKEFVASFGVAGQDDVRALRRDGFLRYPEMALEGIPELVESVGGKLNDKIAELGNECPVSPIPQSVRLAEPGLHALLRNRELNECLRGYFRARPLFHSFDAWVGLSNGGKSGSPLLHLDSGGEKIIRLYIYLNEVGPQNGAFSFLPRSLSRRFSDRSGYLGNAIQDSDFLRIGGEIGIGWDDIRQVSGPAGTGFLIDTAQCFHFGSRISVDRRLTIILTWMINPDAHEAHAARSDLRQILSAAGENLDDYPSLIE
ncbi:hypothetical protein [Pacificispira sp.]|uniref:hypothetical protein n=1 Tax=Pacificispira sp. TaxID=2888761 RepID=UPI003B52D513